MTALLNIAVGVVVARRRAVSAWTDSVWCPVGVLAAPPAAAPWSLLAEDRESATYYAGPAEIALYRSETGNYRDNLSSGAPSIWVVLQDAEGDPPYAIAAVTADPTEGEGWSEPGHAIVEAVPMPQAVQAEIAAFIERYPPGPGFAKRRRDRADPEALARRVPPAREGR